MIGKGIFEVKAGDKVYGFRFGMYAASVTQKQAGKLITQVFADMYTPVEIEEDGKKVRGLKINENTTMCLLQYLYGGAVAYAEDKKQAIPSIVEVGDWMDAIGLDEAIRVWTESVKPPNAESPELKTPGNITE